MNFKTLGPKTARLFTALHDQNKYVFDLQTAAELMRVDRPHAAGILHAASKRGLVTSIQRGLYNLVPLELGSTGSHLQDRYEIVCARMGEIPYCLSYASALDLHQLVTQPTFEVFVSTPRRLEKRNIAGAIVHFVTTEPARFFGYAPYDIGNGQKGSVTDIEKTLIDALNMPRYCGGIVEVAKAFFMAKGRINPTRLVEYARLMRKDAIIRRMGFMLEILEIADKSLIDRLASDLKPAAVALDSTIPAKSSVHSKRWGLRLNVSPEEITKAVSN